MCARAHVRLKSSKLFCILCCVSVGVVANKERERERERERELVEEFGKRRRRSFFCVFCVLLCVSVGVVAQREREREGIWKNENKKYGRRSCGFLFFCEGVGK